MSLSAEFIQKTSKEIAKAKKFKPSDLADQILQLIQELKRLMKKPPTNKEEEVYFDERLSAIIEKLNKIIDDEKQASSTDYGGSFWRKYYRAFF